MFCIQIELEKKKPRVRGERVARNMAFIFSVLLSRFLFFCIMAPICCAPVVLGNDSFLIASAETWVLELPITKLKKCTFTRVSNPFNILRPELFGCLWLLEDKHIIPAHFKKQNVHGKKISEWRSKVIGVLFINGCRDNGETWSPCSECPSVTRGTALLLDIDTHAEVMLTPVLWVPRLLPVEYISPHMSL